MVRYIESVENIQPNQLTGFFVGWPNPPSPEMHLKMLKRSFRVVLAIDEHTGQVVGFINAVGDGVLSCYIPLLEVLPSHQNQGIGSELVRRMLDGLKDFYMVDLICDQELQPFYERFGMITRTGMAWRNFDRQSGKS